MSTSTDGRPEVAAPPAAAASRSLVRYDGPRTTEDLAKYSNLLAGTMLSNGNYARNETLPAAFRGNPSAVAFAVEYGKALNVSPVTALVGIHIVDGKPTASAGLISALIRRAGHKIRTWTEGSLAEGDLKGITTITRADDPDFVYRSEWSLERAVRARLMKIENGKYVASKPKSAWDTYPESMVKSRSITECARDAAEDAIMGVHYTPEELGADVDESGEPVYAAVHVEQVHTTPPPDAGGADQPPGVAEASPGDRAAMADEVREAIIACQTVEDLMAVWNGPILAGLNERAQALETANAKGEAISILDVVALAGEALRHDKRDKFLLDVFGIETVDGEVVEEDTPLPDGDDTPAADPDPDEVAAAEHDAGEDATPDPATDDATTQEDK